MSPLQILNCRVLCSVGKNDIPATLVLATTALLCSRGRVNLLLLQTSWLSHVSIMFYIANPKISLIT